MNDGVTIVFAVIFVLVTGLFIVMIKEVRTHRFWQDLVAANDIDAIRGILDQEVERWRTMRPPKGVAAGVWRGVQSMSVLQANARYVALTTSADADFRIVEGRQTQVATALDTAFATAMRLVEMVFYDVPDYRPEVVRVDVYTTYHDAQGRAESQPILSVTADRADAMRLDWGIPPRELALAFEASFRLGPGDDALPIDLPPQDPELVALSAAPAAEPSEDTAGDNGDDTAESTDRTAEVR